MIRACAALVMVFVLLTAHAAAAGPPTDQLRRAVDLVVKILADPELKKETKTAERRRLIFTVADEIFDFGEISQRTLARHWQARTPAERTEFVGLFGDLLEHAYVSKVENYSGEQIRYVGEAVDGNLAVVRTLVVTKQGTEIPVDYRMVQKGTRWRAYDVTLEGVSLVANYRAQFNTIVQRSGYADLVAKLKTKQAERPGSREVGRHGDAAQESAAPPGLLPRQNP